jgi:very-short-patch-repair endonuclease
MRKQGRYKDLSGQRFGLLVAVEPAGRAGHGKTLPWKCRCDCGNEVVVASQSLSRGDKKTCGCRRAFVTHGTSSPGKQTKAYVAWSNIRNRGKRCERWQSYENFLLDMGEPPAGKFLIRTNDDEDFGPNNCSWGVFSNKGRNAAEPILAEALCEAFGVLPVCEFKFHPTRRWRLDVAFPEAKIGIELHGFRYHSSAKARRNDMEKSNALIQHGWRLLVFMASDVFSKSKLAQIVETVGEVFDL